MLDFFYPYPTEPSLTDVIEPAQEVTIGVLLNSALSYAASQTNYLGTAGLLYPFSSSVLRDILSAAADVAEATPLAVIAISEYQALVSEWQSASVGECQ